MTGTHNDAPRVILTGDTHGDFTRIIRYCTYQNLTSRDLFIILGDVALNYNYREPWRDRERKERLARLPVTFFCIHGNHEMRPGKSLGYVRREFRGGQVWVEPEFPNLLFAIDGEIYDFLGNACLVIGGAYSVDKNYRLRSGLPWFPDEQPSDAIKERVEEVLEGREWQVDVVFSHTCPRQYEPTEVFLPGINQNLVDKSTENWLEKIEQRLCYKAWYCGHYHTEKTVGKLRFMFNDYTQLPPKAE